MDMVNCGLVEAGYSGGSIWYCAASCTLYGEWQTMVYTWATAGIYCSCAQRYWLETEGRNQKAGRKRGRGSIYISPKHPTHPTRHPIFALSLYLLFFPPPPPGT